VGKKLKVKTDKLRSIGKQSRDSVESVPKKKREATVGRTCKKEGFKPGMKELRGCKWCVDGTDGGSTTKRTGQVNS